MRGAHVGGGAPVGPRVSGEQAGQGLGGGTTEGDDMSDWKTWPIGTAIVIGLLLGTVVGLLLDELGLWIAIGVILGAVLDGANQARRKGADRR